MRGWNRIVTFLETFLTFFVIFRPKVDVPKDEARFVHNALTRVTRRIDSRYPEGPYFFLSEVDFGILHFSNFGPRAQGPGPGPGPGSRSQPMGPAMGTGPRARAQGPGLSRDAGTRVDGLHTSCIAVRKFHFHVSIQVRRSRSHIHDPSTRLQIYDQYIQAYDPSPRLQKL